MEAVRRMSQVGRSDCASHYVGLFPGRTTPILSTWQINMYLLVCELVCVKFSCIVSKGF